MLAIVVIVDISNLGSIVIRLSCRFNHVLTLEEIIIIIILAVCRYDNDCLHLGLIIYLQPPLCFVQLQSLATLFSKLVGTFNDNIIMMICGNEPRKQLFYE